MKSNLKLLILAAILLAALAAAVVIIANTKGDDDSAAEEETTVTTENPSRLLYDKNPDNIVSISVENETGSYTIKKLLDDYWAVEEFAGLINDPVLISEVRENMASFTASQTAAENADDLSVYGLDKPRAVIKTTFEDGTERTVTVGADTPKSGLTYATLDGKNDVYAINTDTISDLLKGKFWFLERTVYTKRQPQDENDKTDYGKIDTVTIKRKDLDYDIILEYDKRQDDENIISGNSSSHIMISPVRLDLDPDASYDLINGVFGLTANDIAIAAPSDEMKQKYGLDDPFCTVTWSIAGEDFSLYIGNEYKGTEETSGGYYCMADGFDVIFTFAKDKVPWTVVKPEKITMPLITSNYIYNINSFEMATSKGDFKFTLNRNKDDFSAFCETTGEETDPDLFKNFYQYFLKAPAEEIYLEENNDPAYLTVKISTDDLTDTVEFIDNGDRMCVIRLNGKTSFRCRKTYVARLEENLDRMFAGEDILTTW